MTYKKEIDEELREIAPGLGDLKGKEYFSVPHNYFKQLPDRVFEQIRTEQAQPGLLERLGYTLAAWFAPVKQPQYALAYAAVLVLIVAAVFLNQSPKTQDLFAEISSEEAFEYVLANIDDYDALDIYALRAPSDDPIGGLNDIPTEELGEALDGLLDELDIESLEELF